MIYYTQPGPNKEFHKWEISASLRCLLIRRTCCRPSLHKQARGLISPQL